MNATGHVSQYLDWIQGRPWRIAICVALMTSAFSILLSVILFQQVHNSRIGAYKQQCIDVNKRHDMTIRSIDALVAQQTPKQRKAGAQGVKQFKLLIDAQLPVRDCDAFAQHLLNAPD